MTTPTYEITTTEDGAPALMKCMLCGARNSDPSDIARLYCPRCNWFHEPRDPRVLEMEDAIRRAAGDVASAAELAEAAGADAALIGHLRQALRSLRASLMSG